MCFLQGLVYPPPPLSVDIRYRLYYRSHSCVPTRYDRIQCYDVIISTVMSTASNETCGTSLERGNDGTGGVYEHYVLFEMNLNYAQDAV